jgi:Lipocalin-like domain
MNHVQLKGCMLALCLLALTMFSCKKETDLDTLLLGRWQIISVKVANQEVYDSFVDACDKDNTLNFEAAGKGASDAGTIKCSTTEPQSMPFSWTWKDKASKKLSINENGDITELAITEINGSTMKADLLELGLTASITFTKK